MYAHALQQIEVEIDGTWTLRDTALCPTSVLSNLATLYIRYDIYIYTYIYIYAFIFIHYYSIAISVPGCTGVDTVNWYQLCAGLTRFHFGLLVPSFWRVLPHGVSTMFMYHSVYIIALWNAYQADHTLRL